MSRRMIDEGALNSALEGKQDKLKAGDNITISDDNTISASGGSTVTGQTLLDNITKATPNDGFTYRLANDGKLIIEAKGRYEYKHGKAVVNLHASAKTYDVGDTIPMNSNYSINFGYFLNTTPDYVSVFPSKDKRVDGEPVWKVVANPNTSGTANIYAECIKAGTLSAYKNYGDANVGFVYLFWGNY